MSQNSRGFSLRTATFLVVSSTVGGGVLSTSGFVAIDVGSNRWMLVLWLVGGVIAACGALTLAEVSAALPRSGGEYAILSETYGPLVGFLSGWVSLVFGFVAPIAATGSAAADYLLIPFGVAGPATVRGVATAAILAFTLAHATGRSHAERVQGLVTSATIACLSAFILVGLVAGWPHRASLYDGPGLRQIPGSAMFVGLIFVSYAYSGWNGASYVAGEVAEAQRILPRAIVLGMGIVVVLYLALNVVFALALPIRELRSIQERLGREALEGVADLAANRLFGARGAAFASVAMGVVLLASLSAMLLTGPRVAFAMARDGRLPRPLGRLTTKGHSPAIATALVGTGAILLLWTGGFEQIVFAAGVGLSLNSLLTVAAVYVLRRTRPDLPRPFRVPGYPAVPAIYLILTTASLAFAFVDPDMQLASLCGLAGVAAGVPVYLLGRGRMGEEDPGRR